MLLKTFLFAFLFVYSVVNADDDVEKEFKEHKVVPDIIAEVPKALVKIFYGEKEVKIGEEMKPDEVKEAPKIEFEGEKDAFYTVIFGDADAPSVKEPTKRSYLHQLVVNIPGSEIKEGAVIQDYVGPNPDKDTGIHRYVFLVFKQEDKIDQEEIKKEVKERESFNVEEFVKKHKLGNAIAGNFIKTQHEEKKAKEEVKEE